MEAERKKERNSITQIQARRQCIVKQGDTTRCNAMGMSVMGYPVRLAKFTVKRDAANKLSICLGIACKVDGAGRIQKR